VALLLGATRRASAARSWAISERFFVEGFWV